MSQKSQPSRVTMRLVGAAVVLAILMAMFALDGGTPPSTGVDVAKGK